MYDGMIRGTGGILFKTGLKGAVLGLGVSFSWHSRQCATRLVGVKFSSSQSRGQGQRRDELRNEVNDTFVWTEYRVSNMAVEVRQQVVLLFERPNAIPPPTSVGSLWIFRIIVILSV